MRKDKLWFDVPDEKLREYLVNYLKSPQFTHKTWDEIKTKAFVPENEQALDDFFAAKEKKRFEISEKLKTIADLDEQIDEHVFNLYGIFDEKDKARILNNAPLSESAEQVLSDG